MLDLLEPKKKKHSQHEKDLQRLLLKRNVKMLSLIEMVICIMEELHNLLNEQERDDSNAK